MLSRIVAGDFISQHARVTNVGTIFCAELCAALCAPIHRTPLSRRLRLLLLNRWYHPMTPSVIGGTLITKQQPQP